MKLRRLNNRGVALILVILMISVIIGVTLELNVSSRSEVYEAANLSDGIRLSYIAKSGLYMAGARLAADTNGFDALTEEWARPELLSAKSENYFSGGGFKVSIEDESGKIPLHVLAGTGSIADDVRNLLVRFLSLPEFELGESRANEIADCIKDWIDTDDEVTGSGAERSYYAGLERPYPVKNGPLESREELLMVKGITADLYYGTEKKPGLEKFVTIYGGGKININTAPKLVLRALAREMTPDMVEAMDEYRKKEENNLSDPLWYKKVIGMNNVAIPTGLIAVASNCFQITSTGRLGNMSETVTGVVKREPGKKSVKLLSWRVG